MLNDKKQNIKTNINIKTAENPINVIQKISNIISIFNGGMVLFAFIF